MKRLILLLTIIVTYSVSGQNTFNGKVVDKNNEPLPGVNISIEGTTMGTSTDFNGVFSITTDKKDAILTFSIIGFKNKKVKGKTNMSIEMFENTESLSEIVIVGSRNPRQTKLETPVAVDIVNLSKIKETAPQTRVNDMLTYIVPSFNSNRQSSAGGTEHIDPASLRGLGPDQVLVLINGKRRHTTSLINTLQTVGNGSVGTDLSAIPAAAIDRIEVLRDGASAQYGSDAIAGVINVILKKSKGLEASTTYGINSKGEGQTINANINYGATVGNNGFINLTAEFNKRGSTNLSGSNNLVIYDQSDLGNYFAYDFSNPGAKERDDELIAAAGLTRDDFNFHVGDSESQDMQFFMNMSLPTGKKGQFYVSGGLNYRTGKGYPFRRLPSEGHVLEIYPNGFQPIQEPKISDVSMITGFKTKLKDWNFDISNTIGRNRFDYSVSNTVNDYFGASSPTSFKSGGHSFLQNTVNLDIAKFDEKVMSGLGLAFGAEFRYENYQIYAGEEGSYIGSGAQSSPGFTTTDAVNKGRTSTSLYADFEFNFTDKFMIGTAGRFEDYSDFGSTINGKIDTRYKISDNFALRGSASTGFRAPSLHQRYYSQIITDLVDGKLVEIGNFRNDSEVAKELGIPKLKQETSVNFSVGLTSKISNRFQVTLDAYQINIKNRIIYTGALGNDPFGNPVPELKALFEPLGVASARFFANAVDTNTKGIDLVMNYKVPFNKGNLNFSLLYNHNENKVDDKLKNVPPAFVGQEDVYFGPQEKSLIETNSPKNKVIFTIDYSGRNKFGFMLRNTYWGKVTRNGFPFGVSQEHKPKVVTDATVSYKFTDKLSLSSGASNIFNIYPDKQVYENTYFGVFPYAPVQMGLTGAYYFARLSYRM